MTEKTPLEGIAALLHELKDQLIEISSPLEADVWMAAFLATVVVERGLPDPDRAVDVAELAIGGVVAAVRERPTWEGVAFLRAADLALVERQREEVDKAVAEAVAAGITEPWWADRAPVEAGSCWHTFLDDALDVVSFSFVRGDDHHVVTTEIDPARGVVVDISLTRDVDGERAQQLRLCRKNPDLTFAPLTAEAAAGRLARALDAPPQFRGVEDDVSALKDRLGDLAVLRAHLAAALRGQPGV